MMLHCNAVSHWLGTYTKWSLMPVWWSGDLKCQGTSRHDTDLWWYVSHMITTLSKAYHKINVALNLHTKSFQGLTLRCACMPGTCRFCPRAHKLLWLCAQLGKWLFTLDSCLFSQQYKSAYRDCTNIGSACEIFFRAHTFLEHAPWACKTNA